MIACGDDGEALKRDLEERSARASWSSPGILEVNLPVDALEGLRNHPAIRRATLPVALFPALDIARGVATSLDVAAARYRLGGNHVFLGVIDSGVDWRHPDFYDDQGRSVIDTLLWIPSPGPSGAPAILRFCRNDLQGALQDLASPIPRDPSGHGTHCASIAFGSGRASSRAFRGVARQTHNVAIGLEETTDTALMTALRELFHLAGDHPAVASISFSGHRGPHDGTTALEELIDEVSGPGRLVIVCAGNDADKGIHTHVEFKGSALLPFVVADDDHQGVEAWVTGDDQLEVRLQCPDGTILDEATAPRHVPHGEVRIFGAEIVDGSSGLRVFVDLVAGEAQSSWALLLRSHTDAFCHAHAWGIATAPNTQKGIFPDSVRDNTVAIPGTAKRAITVGAFVSKTGYQSALHGWIRDSTLCAGVTSPFSGLGPTRDGRDKPDVIAPGQYVTAALADGSLLSAKAFEQVHYPDHRYITLDGTSMATPFVAGTIALLLEREPTLTPEDIKARIAARLDPRTKQLDARLLLRP